MLLHNYLIVHQLNKKSVTNDVRIEAGIVNTFYE